MTKKREWLITVIATVVVMLVIWAFPFWPESLRVQALDNIDSLKADIHTLGLWNDDADREQERLARIEVRKEQSKLPSYEKFREIFSNNDTAFEGEVVLESTIEFNGMSRNGNIPHAYGIDKEDRFIVLAPADDLKEGDKVELVRVYLDSDPKIPVYYGVVSKPDRLAKNTSP
jgi:hypothetical protein